MSSDRTFYINKAWLNLKEKKIQKDYWDDVSGDWALGKLQQVLNDEVDLKFKKINIVIVWIEYRDECDKFRSILKKYRIEFQET